MEAAGPPPATGEVLTPAAYYNALQLAYVYAGYANRVLGENMCAGTIDGGPELPSAVYLTRAESLFTKAIGMTGGTAATLATEPRRPINAPQLSAIGPRTMPTIANRSDCNNQTCEIVEFSHNAKRTPSGNVARLSHVQHDRLIPQAITLRRRSLLVSHPPRTLPATSTDHSNVIKANESGISCRHIRWPSWPTR